MVEGFFIEVYICLLFKFYICSLVYKDMLYVLYKVYMYENKLNWYVSKNIYVFVLVE